MAKPYYKRSHTAWYVNWGGRPKRLAADEKTARAEYDTLMAQQNGDYIRGVDLQTIATIMGHADLKMLSKVYQHIRKRSDHIKEGLRRATGEVA